MCGQMCIAPNARVTKIMIQAEGRLAMTASMLYVVWEDCSVMTLHYYLGHVGKNTAPGEAEHTFARMKNSHHDRPASGPTRRQMPSHIISPHLTCLPSPTQSFSLRTSAAGLRWHDRPDSSPSTDCRGSLGPSSRSATPPGNLVFLVPNPASARKRGSR